jgi:hypothetical protein
MLMKLEFSRQVFEKYSHINFMRIRVVGAELFRAGGRTDGRKEANSRSSKFCESTQKLYGILLSPVMNMMAMRNFFKIESFHVEKICTSLVSSLYERSTRTAIAGSITSGIINYNNKNQYHYYYNYQ